MVCLSDDMSTQVVVKDMTDHCNVKPFNITLFPSMTVSSLFTTVSYHYNVDPNFVLTLHNNFSETYVLNQYMDKKLCEIPGLSLEQRSTILVSLVKKKNMNLCVQASPEDDLLLGASASPTTGEAPASTTPLVPSSESIKSTGEQDCSYMRAQSSHSSTDACNYVGLVNQAMTCYLNSLLQALYMTPEFRNALYNWEFDGSNPGTSIPFQLQRLFLNLQTSAKSAVETTDLTHSFGWNMQQAWEQHDIQELCRVMFDALEQKFKDTKQANLINDLYEGKMLDYVKCLECSTEKSREDTFQDIPLPVRPFGSNVAYNSVEEALRAFVQPETLEGTNQYHCEKCNKKCDAHKGLKFTKFPYLLTLHLKRFDFDYSTMNRIKLNDKVVFPEKLNLNSFIPTSSEMNNGSSEDTMEDRETVVKCDDCSTTDSGSALDDESCQGTDISSMANEQLSSDCQDDDEGIDVSSGNNENEKNRLQEPKGPYIYELFSIMIHSGSASGGHYYAYIKDFSKNQWFCFNDQIVTRVTEDDIHKTYGGGPQRGYYSGAYTSSTNAYMLMYRQIDKERNRQAYTADEFPPHIKQLLLDMRHKEENDRLRKEKENDTFKIKMYCNIQNQVIEEKMLVFGDTLLSEATSDAHSKFKLEDVVRLEDCRLVVYSKNTESIVYSLEEDCKFSEIPPKYTEFWLDIKKPDEDFEVYKMGGVSMRAYLINLETELVDSPRSVWVNPEWTVQDLKSRLSSMFKMEVLHVVQEAYSNQPRYLETTDLPLKFEPRCNGYKLYVSNTMDPDPEKPFAESKLASVIDQFVHVIMLEVALPDTEIGTLELLSIPALDMNQNCDRSAEIGAGDRTSADLRVSPQPGTTGSCELLADQSNSEDSSLSDSDRTLVGDAPGDNIGLLSSSSNSPADQHMASPTDLTTDEDYCDKSFSYGTAHINRPDTEMMWDEEDASLSRNNCSNQNYYFKAQVIEKTESENTSTTSKSCQIQIDKRTSLGRLKKHLEPIIGVPMEYFKIFRQYPNQDMEWSSLTDTLSSIKDGERLLVKLGRVLRSNEYSGKIHFLQLNNNPELVTFWFEWIIAKDQTVASVKKEILHQAKKQYMVDIPLSKCRLRKKHVKAPARVFLDDEKFGDDIIIANFFELYVQEIAGAEKTKAEELLVFVRRWNPESLTLSDFEEVVLDENGRTVDELKQKVSQASGVPLEFVEVAHIKSNFPCDMNVLAIHGKLDWNPEVQSLETYPFNIYDDGGIFYYRDSRQTQKELSMEERKELNKNENKRLGRYSSKMYSPRRERGLKIYVDTSPKREDEAFLD